MLKFTKLKGLIAAPHTPFDRNGDINIQEIAKQVNLLVSSGVTGAYVSGTTGEGISCTVAERRAIMEEWVRLAKGRLFIIVHVGTPSIRDSQDLAAHAQKIGADATSVVPVSIFKPASVDHLIEYLGAIASHAPSLPFYYYHTVMSGVNLQMVEFLESAAGRIPNLAGMKFNSPDLYEFQNCRRACDGRYDMIWGVDEFLAGAVALGAMSAIGSTYNFAAPLALGIWHAVEAGRLETARAGMARLCSIVDILFQYGHVAASKAMMAIHDIDAGDPRLPIKALTAEEKKEIVTRLRAILA